MKPNENIEELKWEINGLLDYIENASIPLHSVNGSGIIIWANKAELDFLGYSKEEYLGKHISHFHANKNIIEDILIRLTNKETLKNYPAQLKCKNGEIKSVVINSNVLWKKNDLFIPAVLQEMHPISENRKCKNSMHLWNCRKRIRF